MSLASNIIYKLGNSIQLSEDYSKLDKDIEQYFGYAKKVSVGVKRFVHEQILDDLEDYDITPIYRGSSPYNKTYVFEFDIQDKSEEVSNILSNGWFKDYGYGGYKRLMTSNAMAYMYYGVRFEVGLMMLVIGSNKNDVLDAIDG